MNFGQSYFDVLTSRIGGASSIWNRHGTSQINSRNMITGIRGTSRTTGLGYNNSYFGLGSNTIKAMNKAFNSTYSKQLSWRIWRLFITSFIYVFKLDLMETDYCMLIKR